jgi:2-alkyl-3-oxoalkanoate reductase
MSKTGVFITGATGCVGSFLAKYLLKKDYRVTACVRPSSKLDRLERFLESGGKLVRAELKDVTGLVAAMKDSDVIVHAAASIQPLGKQEYLNEVNVEGTRSVIEAAKKAGARHFIHISSLSVITGENDRYGVTEEEQPKYCREAYANSKIDAEKVAMHEAAKGEIAVTSLRPGFIYGPNEHTWLPRLIIAFAAETAMFVGDGKKETNVIYVENLCRAIELAMLNPKAFGQIYNLTDGEVVSKRKLFDTICDALNLPRVKTTISPLMARMLLEAANFLAPISPGPIRDRLSKYSLPAFRLVAINQGFDISKAERELNYRDRIPFVEGMTKTLEDWPHQTAKTSASTRNVIQQV